MSHGLRRHPLSEAWGNMPERQLLELAEDIKNNGQKDAVVVFEDMVLDGWHRCQGCQIAGVDVRTIDYQGTNPIAYVISKNAHRRSQTASQRAAAIVRCHEWFQSGDNQHAQGGGAPGSPPPTSNEQMATEAGVSVRTVQQAKVAEGAGMGQAVVDGEISAKAAAKQARRNHGNEQKLKTPTEIKKLKAENAGLRESIDELTDELQSYLDVSPDEKEQQVKLAQLRKRIRVLESQLNEHKQIANSFKRECHALRKRLGE